MNSHVPLIPFVRRILFQLLQFRTVFRSQRLCMQTQICLRHFTGVQSVASESPGVYGTIHSGDAFYHNPKVERIGCA